jgi:transketolase
LADNNKRIIGLDGDMSNSTFSETLWKKYPEQYVECFIAGKILEKIFNFTTKTIFLLTQNKPFQFSTLETQFLEQNMVGVGIGLGCRARAIPFVSTFAAFLTRAADQIR